MLTHPTRDKLMTLKLFGMAKALEEQTAAYSSDFGQVFQSKSAIRTG